MNKKYKVDKIEELFSDTKKYDIWKDLWAILAYYQHELGAKCVSESQVIELINAKIDENKLKEIEKETKHDIAAGIKLMSQICPEASKIIHLGATSSYISDNTDLIRYKLGLKYIHGYIFKLMKTLVHFILSNRKNVIIGYTHYQQAQSTSLSKRFSVYLNSIFNDFKDIDNLIDSLEFHGCRGAVGNSISMMALFDQDYKKVKQLNQKLAEFFGFKKVSTVCNQTYDRKIDSKIANAISNVAETLYKVANDIRLMQHDDVLYESFDAKQIGSSAMPYKKNPIYSERVCSICRYIIVNSINTKFNSINQWLERTLDDSANKRIVFPELFNYISYVILLMNDIINSIKVNDNYIYSDRVKEHIPDTLVELVIIECVKNGANRQNVYERLKNLNHMNQIDDKIGLIQDVLNQYGCGNSEILIDITSIVGDDNTTPKELIEEILDYMKNSIKGADNE